MEINLIDSLVFTGTHVNYYFICKRKLWLFSHYIQMEQESDVVLLGKLLGEERYPRRHKEISIDDTIVVDSIDFSKNVLHEVKKSRAVDKAHRWQVLYYLYYFKQKGIELTAEIDYPIIKRKDQVVLTEQLEREMEIILTDIQTIISDGKIPERIDKRFCRKCAYFEFCWGE